MKTLSKVLSMLIVIVMCLSLFGASAYAMPIVYGAEDETSNSWDQGIQVPQIGNPEEQPGAFDEPYEIPGSEDKPVIGNENEIQIEGEDENGNDLGISLFSTEDAVWQVGNNNYITLQEAVKAAGTNGRITLTGSTILTNECKISKSVTIDLAGQTMAVDSNGLITITAGTVTLIDSDGNGAIEHSGVLANVTGGTLVINGGSYGEPSFGGSGTVVIKNGSFTNKPADKYIDSNSSWSEDAAAVVAAAEKIASINGKGYDTVQKAVDAATSGQTIVINTSEVGNISAGEVTVNSKNITFNVNDETVIFDSLNINNANVTITGYEIRGAVTLENSTLNLSTQKAETVYVRNSSTLNVNGGTVGIVGINNAAVKMSSGTIESLTAKANSTLNISGGYVNSFAIDAPGSANRAITGGTWVINNNDALDYFKNSLSGNLKADETKAPTYTVTGSGSNPDPGTTNPPTSGSYSVSTSGYTKGSNRAVYITAASNVSMPTAIWYGTTRGTLVASLDIDYTSGRNTYIENSDLDAMATGTYYLYAEVNGTAYYAGALTIYSSGTSIPDYDGTLQVGTRYENDWYQGDDPLQFYVSPNPDRTNGANMKVSIDGRELGNLDYYDYLNGYFYIGTAKLASLSSGTHWLTVENTKTGETGSCTFYVGPTLRARDTNKHVTGSSKDLKFVCSEPITRVWVGDKELDNYDSYDYYTLSRDGKTLTLTARFLNNRTAGSTYNLTVETNTGERVSTTFQILTTAQASSSPKTGDNSNLALWVSALVMSGAAAAVILPKMKKKEIEG